jgi:hypothetical protein
MRNSPKQSKEPDQHSEQETARRRDEWLRRTLNSPPKPHKDVVAERKTKRAGRETKKR